MTDKHDLIMTTALKLFDLLTELDAACWSEDKAAAQKAKDDAVALFVELVTGFYEWRERFPNENLKVGEAEIQRVRAAMDEIELHNLNLCTLYNRGDKDTRLARRLLEDAEKELGWAFSGGDAYRMWDFESFYNDSRRQFMPLWL